VNEGRGAPRVRECPLCDGRLRPWVHAQGREICVCASCSHVTVPAGLARDESGYSIYESPTSVFDSDGNADYYRDETAVDAAREKLALVRAQTMEGAALLDVGSGFGQFLWCAQGAFDAHGVELNRSAVEWSRREFQVQNHIGSLYALPDAIRAREFDVVTAWDVIEHLEHPREAVRRLRACVRPGGRLLLSTPDAGAPVARVLGRHWHYLDPVQHLNLFSRRNLGRLLEQEGLTVTAAGHLGRGYRVRYITSRMRYFAQSSGAAAFAARLLNRLPETVQRMRVRVKLWDVMYLAARRV
jgi:2-polyprenyl-3-methyl-5-hydroxy-6-metoxy-1,4-benzoquinol methylase